MLGGDEYAVFAVTHAFSAPPAPADDMEAAADLLRSRGHRVSAARRLVLSALFAAEAPVSAEEIASGLGGRLPASDLASVYRNLETLEQIGLVRHVHLGHGAGRYKLAQAEERVYVVCERCERVDIVDSDALDEVRGAIERIVGYQASFAHFPIVGVCASCATAQAREERHDEPPDATDS
jgi:Fur family ferric uptake transcriptional regulator